MPTGPSDSNASDREIVLNWHAAVTDDELVALTLAQPGVLHLPGEPPTDRARGGRSHRPEVPPGT